MPAASLPSYAELHCLSNFSFLRGASHPEELVERAAALGYSSLAITDECSVAGVVRAHVAAKAHPELKLLIGAEFQLATEQNVPGAKLLLLAQTREGYGNLAMLITTGRRRAEKGSYHLLRADFELDLAHCLAILVPSFDDHDLARAAWLAEHFAGRAWIAAELLCGPDDRTRLDTLEALSSTSELPLVAAGDVHMHVRSRRPLQDMLTATCVGKPIAACGHALFPNAERHLRLRVRLANLYPAALLAESLAIAQRCTFSLDELRYEYPDEVVPTGMSAAAYLRTLTEAGLLRRFPRGTSPSVRKLIEHELTLIADLGYEPYFLTVYDIVRFARERNILCQGRGSAANSAVCYALGITEVDPARLSMLFERFISRERNEPPDIDVDFEHERREEVIQYLYTKYGRDRAALTATVITYRSKSAVRDIGRALGLELEQVDRLSKSLAWWDGRKALPERMVETGLDPESPTAHRLFMLMEQLVGFPRHLSQHTGGFVLARGLLSRLVPIENAAMADRSVIQWDKDDLDALGLLKVDVLALGMLTAIRRALDMISARRGTPLTLQDVPPEDSGVYDMICTGETMGVFQIESRAQMTMLPRLRPRCFFDLVIEVAIVRPGPIQGGMVHPYLRRRAGEEPVVYPSEAVRGVLERTLGIPIFQEQVMQLAVVAAGFTPGEADRLRRAMAAWRRKGGLEPFERRLKDGMRERGYPEAFADQIFQQILGFGEYGFPESHSASFALLVYVSAWLKRYEPAAFCAALLNSQPMGFYAPAQLVQDARRNGVEIRPVDVLVSRWECTLEGDADRAPILRLGMLMVKGLAQASAERIVVAREAASIATIESLARRAQLDSRDLKALAAAGAFASIVQHRREAYWDVAGIRAAPRLLADAPIEETMPVLAAPSEAEDLIADYASLGLSLGRHPLELLRDALRARRLSTAAEIRAMPDRRLARAAGIVTNRQRPETASGVVFMTLEDETGYINVVVWQQVLEDHRRAVLGARLLTVYGVIQREGDVVHLVARHVIDSTPLLTELLGPLSTTSRDFH